MAFLSNSKNKARFLCLAFILLYGCGNRSSNTDIPVSTPPPDTRTCVAPYSQYCGEGLASQDLAGYCRALPNTTMGALEARNC